MSVATKAEKAVQLKAVLELRNAIIRAELRTPKAVLDTKIEDALGELALGLAREITAPD